ncbi:MAG: hypothetical protein PWQ63_1687 [Methanolobus sp.]|jgi:hypothetical protein|nr:hypothetical protein [Methanolobus sp.]
MHNYLFLKVHIISDKMTRFQGRGNKRRKNCSKCDSITVTAYVKKTLQYNAIQKWVRIGYYCDDCGHFEPLKDSETP